MKKKAGIYATAEGTRLTAMERGVGWRRWGPYLSDRQWGTVREDYSASGNAWSDFTHEMARSRAYRWGEDGIGGFSDENQRWCLGLSLWNGQDRMLKERLFGLTNGEGNHGEAVKEHYFHLDGLPSHAYMKMLYRYPQRAFPYEKLVAESAKRGFHELEYTLAETGIFDENRFFDVTIEYAKAAPDDLLMRVTVENRGPETAPLALLPTMWGRNTWSWAPGKTRARIRRADGHGVFAERPLMVPLHLDVDACDEIIFCENETNIRDLYGLDAAGPFKDGFNDYVVAGDPHAILRGEGSRCAFLKRVEIAPGARFTMRVRMRPSHDLAIPPFETFDEIFARRITETDEFYAAVQADVGEADRRLIQRRAFAGMLWSKQFYLIDVSKWVAGDPVHPPPPPRVRNTDWGHVNGADIISMPDKWEYPWFAAWDLAFHCVAFLPIDPSFAKAQLVLLTREWFMHPNGQLPAYEWEFGDVNPPVHAWATWRVYEGDRTATGKADRPFLEAMFHKLLINFTWWVNRKDADGRNIFQGGFLGLDNVGLFDRSKPLPTGGSLDQSDGTAWMAMYALSMMRMALELAETNPVYQDLATKFFEHFLTIAGAMTDVGGAGIGLWDEKDGFFYDVLKLPNGQQRSMRVRSIVGLIPMFAVEILEPNLFTKYPDFARRTRWYLSHRKDLAALISRWTDSGVGNTHLLSLLRGHRLKCLLRRMLDEDEFLSPYGVRALSKAYEAHPFKLVVNGSTFELSYAPGESVNGDFGGNSNWRGPVWMPINYMLIDSLRRFHSYYGDEFQVECPTRSGTMLNLAEIADEITRRLGQLFLRGHDGLRASQCDDVAPLPDGSDALLFHEYFHGDTGRGLGASHQTGWTGLIAMLMTDEDHEPLPGTRAPAAE